MQMAATQGPANHPAMRREASGSIESRENGLWLLHVPGREAPMGFFSEASARSFAMNNLGLVVA